MTEAEWMCCAEPWPMLDFLKSQPALSRRRLRLFACACCRAVWGQLPRPNDRAAVEAAERYAEGLAERAELTAARRATQETVTVSHMEGYWASRPGALEAAVMAAHTCDRRHWDATALLRDVFAPFRPRPDRRRRGPAWLTPGVLSLAEAAYDGRLLPSGELDPQRLAVLADALEDAGCTDQDILAHLRGPGPHARGCWAVDLLTGRQ